MTYPNAPKPGPRLGPPSGGFRPGAPVGVAGNAAEYRASDDDAMVEETGHPAVDAVLRSLANAARLAPAEQIAEYEAAHQVLQETLASIDR